MNATVAVRCERVADVLRSPLALTADELARAERLSARSVASFIAARGLLRALLARALGCEPLAVTLVEPENAKPRLANAELGVDFNVSHAGAWVIVAIARGCRVGVDVEPLAQRRDATAIAAAFGLTLDPTVTFAQQWVRVEARYKAVGRGLTIPIDPTTGADYALADLELDADHAAAIAWSDATATPTIEVPVATSSRPRRP